VKVAPPAAAAVVYIGKFAAGNALSLVVKHFVGLAERSAIPFFGRLAVVIFNLHV
jgi:hypothetical protein